MAKDVTLASLRTSQKGLSRRFELIAQNIANINTPNYKRRDISFTDELAAALDTAASNRAEQVENVSGVVAQEIIEERLFYRPDMGGVDIDREMTELAKTQMKKAAVTQLMIKKISQYRTVIKEGMV